MSLVSPDPKSGRRALAITAQISFGICMIALVFAQYLAQVVEKSPQNAEMARRAGRFDPETTGSVGGRASNVWLNPCSVLDQPR